MGHYTIEDFVVGQEVYTQVTVVQHKGKNRFLIRATRKFYHTRDKYGFLHSPQNIRRYRQRLERAGYRWDGCYVTAQYN